MVNTEQRGLLRYCLDSIARERATLDFETEVLVLDNASQDGSVEVASRHPATTEVIALPERQGKAANDSLLLQRARGRFCMLLNEDSELEPGAAVALYGALEHDDQAGAAGAMLVRPDGEQQPSAWRFPSAWTALLSALWLHKRFVVQSRGEVVRPVDWVQSAAMLVRRSAAEEIGFFDTDFFVYSDEVDFCKRLQDAGHHVLYVPEARAVHHEQLQTGSVPSRRIVEFSRNRDRYMRKHHTWLSAYTVRFLTAWTYLVRALGALVLPNHNPKRYLKHVSATLFPSRGEGLREGADEFNRRLEPPVGRVDFD
ncbi:glycosyltransferase family 2 protein [Solirubrobacter deserti]|uniref:Glycosyltransferase family 2 protein n=1 Tax=Solirubrobacter deserti TaxID=2282478 RepID=A0ABT4RK82_9ACTN|nr:glycosyltransferase family 2 protein [Solirubrobacter deserti]MDA0138905.1 glycosyltransferase family 2 protein [Solirubrobacter deserti]